MAVLVTTGTLKMRDRKMRDWKYRHQTAGVENARLELSAPYSRGWKMRDWKIREQEMYGTPRVAKPSFLYSVCTVITYRPKHKHMLHI